MTRTSTTLSRKKKLCFLLVWLALLLLIAEGIARLWPESMRFVEQTHPEAAALAREEPFFVAEGETVRTSPLFVGRVRSQSFARQPRPGELRVLVLGESSVFGMEGDRSIHPSDAFPSHLAQQIQMRNPGLRLTMINAGMPGVTSLQILRQARYALELRPSLVVVYMGHNDNNEALRLSARGPTPTSFLRRHSYLYGALAYTIRTKVRTETREIELAGASSEAALREFAGAYRELIRIYRERRIPVVVCDIVSQYSTQQPPGRLEAFRAAIRDVAQSERVTFVPVGEHLLRAVKGAGRTWESIFSDSVHPTALGYRWIAEAVYAEIAPQLKLSPGPWTSLRR